MKAMILSAGLGKRMQPLTEDLPKPLIEVKGKPLILHQINNLVNCGIIDIVINVHYMADKIKKFLGNGSIFGANIAYSYEKELLNTGGGIVKALPLLREEPFIVVSADIYSDYVYTDLKLQESFLAHLVFVPNPSYHPKGDYAVASNLVMDMEPRFTYANIGVFSPVMFMGMPVEHVPLKKILQPNIVAGRVSGEIYQGKWTNVGTTDEIEFLHSN